jgi:hypothetical protein
MGGLWTVGIRSTKHGYNRIQPANMQGKNILLSPCSHLSFIQKDLHIKGLGVLAGRQKR